MEHFPTGNGTARIGPPRGYLPIEEHGIVGDLRTVALVGTDGTVDWYCPARFDAPSLFGALLDKDKGGYFSLTARTSYAKPKQLYLPDTNILLTRFQGKDAVGEVIDFMVPETRSDGPGARPAGQAGPRGPRHGHVRARLPPGVRLRQAGPRGRDHPGRRRGLQLAARPRRAADQRPPQGRGQRRRRHVHPGRGRDRRLPPGVERRRPPDHRGRDRRAVHQDPGLLAGLGRPVQVPGPLAGDGAALGARAQAARLPPDRRLVAAPDHVAARGTGRHAQLGLPLRLAAGRLVHRLRADAPRLPRGGRELHGLAAEALRDGHGGTRRHDHVHRRRQRPPPGDDARPPGRLQRRAAGADRQRRGRPAAARRLRRDHGLGVPLQQGGPDLLRPVDRPVQAPGLAQQALDGAGRGHLGDPRPAAALHLLRADDLGRLRARRPPGPRPRPARPGRALAQAGRRRRTGSSRSSAGTPT